MTVNEDVEKFEATLRKAVGSVDEMSDSLLEAQKRFTGFAGQFAEMSSASNKHWTFISRILSGSGLWRVQNRVRALGNFFEILKMSEDKAIEGQKEAIKNFATVQKNVEKYEETLAEIEDIQSGRLKLADSEIIAQADIFRYYKAQYGEAQALAKLEEQIQTAKEKNLAVVDQLSRENNDYQKEGFTSIADEVEKVTMLQTRGYAKIGEEFDKHKQNYEIHLQHQEHFKQEMEVIAQHEERLNYQLELKNEQYENQLYALAQTVAFTKEYTEANQKLLQIEAERAQQVSQIADYEQQVAQFKSTHLGSDEAGITAQEGMVSERQKLAKKSDRREIFPKGLVQMGNVFSKNAKGLFGFITQQGKMQKVKDKLTKGQEKLTGFFNKSKDAMKGIFKFFAKMFFVLIYWGILFALITSAVVGLYQAGFFDLIYEAYINVKDALIANKDVFIAVWTSITAFFGALFALISMTGDSTSAEIEAQKNDVMEKFSTMISSAVTALITLLIIILPVVIEAMVAIIPILIEAFVVLIPLFLTLLVEVVLAVWEGISAYLEQRYGEEADGFWETLGLVFGDLQDWFMNDFYKGEVKTLVDTVVGFFLVRWGILLMIQAVNLKLNTVRTAGAMGFFATFAVLSMIVIGAIAIGIGFQSWAKKSFGNFWGRLLTAVLSAAIVVVTAIVLFGTAILGWPLILLALLVGVIVYAWDWIYDSLTDLFDFFADGGTVTKDNMQIVGEKGPELVKLPVGSKVYPNEVFRMGTTTKQVNQANLTVNISVNGRVGASDSEIRDIASKLGRHIEQEVTKHIKREFRLF